MATKGSAVFDEHVCKGCGLCVSACGVHILELDETAINEKGYHPVIMTDPEKCNGCANCATMCPDQGIVVSKEKR